MLISPIRRKATVPVFRIFQRFNHIEATTEPLLANDDPVHKVDLRVGKIVQIEQHAEATHLFVEQGSTHTYTCQLTCINSCFNSRFEYRKYRDNA